MKVTAALKKELLQWFETFWSTYLKGDIDTWATFIRDDYRNIGGTEVELWNSKQEIIEYTNTIMDQFLGTADIRNREIEVIPYGDYLMVHEFTDLYVKIDGEWTFYAPFRMSSLMEKTDSGWITFHQHGSYPDMKALEGEAFSIDALKAENIKLQEGIKARTLELEEKNRELEIEAALERIRSRSMAMHGTNELSDVILVLFKQLELLGIVIDTCYIDIFDKDNQSFNVYIGTGTAIYPEQVTIPYSNHPIHQLNKRAREDNLEFFTFDEDKKSKDMYFEHFYPNAKGIKVPEERKALIAKGLGMTGSTALGEQSGMAMFNYRRITYSNEENDILKRVNKVFQQTYIRFLDLQRAENQAKEAKIEAALERIRASTMAMHKSYELAGVVKRINRELLNLNIHLDNTQILTDITNDPQKGFNNWIAVDGMDYLHKFHFPYLNHAITHRVYKNREKQIAFYSEQVGEEEKNSYFKLVFKYSDLKTIPKERQKLVFDAPGWTRGIVFLKDSILVFGRYDKEAFNEEETEIFVRIAKVFEQAYTRFLDLQKAENQAREAQIEASLERVRSKTMAMHSSQDVGDTMIVLFEELESLGIKAERNGILIMKENQKAKFWTAKPSSKNEVELLSWSLDMKTHDMTRAVYKAWEDKQANLEYELKGAKLKSYYKSLNNATNFPKQINLKTLPAVQWGYISNFAEGSIYIFTAEQMPEKNLHILNRFTSVFSQTYRRYQDLVRATEQAHEAKIEAALERVRSKAMAMHHTDDLSHTIEAFYEQLSSLIESKVVRCGAGLLNKETTMGEIISASRNSNGEIYSIQGSIDMIGLPILDNTYKAWLRQKEYHHILKGNEIKAYYQHMTNQLALPDNNTGDELHFYFPMFAEGSFYLVTESELPQKELVILRRFSSVLSLTYRRFNDLQKAEAREREAVKQASLDRVRGEIASMRTAEDLERITPLVWKELTALGVPFFRCGVFIIREDEEMVHAYLSTPDGKSVAALHLPFSDRDAQLIKPAVDNWRKQKPYKEEWDQEQFVQQTRSFMEKGQIENPQSYQVMDTPPERLVLHLVPFRQGMLYVGHSEDLNEEQLALVESLALTFSVAYSRYEDFKALEDTKNSLELTLRDLKSTQTQLIQAEKMASLGELTAGIAHEIQNPLNFVNNFSEVSKELLEEMLEDLKNGDIEEVDAIASDVIANLEKILHHGQRADGIVKGMLQHSRSNSGKKELADINQLVDEYLRLAYHGLRAKDKSFNASLETDFDDSIEQQEFIAQDIGRVVLNLITNAFYACNQKKKTLDDSEAEAFQPTVKVSSKNLKDHLEISIEDNGNGIPKHIIDKIFQPFFTTKPTGEGTGLGLSLSYDIIKAHGGTLTVESEEEKGTRFTINLPVNS